MNIKFKLISSDHAPRRVKYVCMTNVFFRVEGALN
jgi:hypothetical protein|tara:strand:- start:435 stop:539 length:105 start_codon:yes stop_codon:yes gene_type:complete